MLYNGVVTRVNRIYDNTVTTTDSMGTSKVNKLSKNVRLLLNKNTTVDYLDEYGDICTKNHTNVKTVRFIHNSIEYIVEFGNISRVFDTDTPYHIYSRNGKLMLDIFHIESVFKMSETNCGITLHGFPGILTIPSKTYMLLKRNIGG